MLEARAESAVVIHAPEIDAATLLDRALDGIGWWSRIDEIAARREVRPNELRITLAVDMSYLRPGGSTGVEVAFVEHLVARFHQHGYPSVAVGVSVPEEGLWYENRDARALADLVGYRYVTPDGAPYDAVSFQEDLVAGSFPETSVLYRSQVGRAWAEADVRVNVAKNKTHELFFYALGLYNMIGVLPLADRRFHYFERLRASEVAADLLAAYPPHLSLIDAVVSNHGAAGSRVEEPLHTATVIAATSTILGDWIGALKMRLDPFASPLNAAVLRRAGTPRGHTLVGSLEPYPGWVNVPPSLADVVARLHLTPEIGASLEPIVTLVDSDVFPQRNLYAGRLNALLEPYLASVQRNPLALALLVVAAGGAAAFSQALDVSTTLFRKDRLQRIEAGLTIDPFTRNSSDYEDIEEYIDGLEALATAIPSTDDGIRLMKLDAANLFVGERTIAEPFDAFVARVDVARGIEMMNDYIGGWTVAVHRDDRGRVTHQAERNIYLPQPNFIALYGGQQIDVTKLEYISRSRDRHRIVWRTIKSDNDSADFDDGSVTFVRHGEQTLVRISAYQKFRLPPLLQLARLDLWPQLLDALTLDAYRVYLDGTVANIEAAFDGDEYRIGRTSDPSASEGGTALADERLAQFGGELGKLGERLASRLSKRSPLADGGDVDAEGFRHFRGTPQRAPADAGVSAMTRAYGAAALEFYTGLARAIARDFSE